MDPGTKPKEFYRDKNGMHPLFVLPADVAEVAADLDDLAGAGRTTETVKANADAIATKVPTSRQVIAGTGLSGGGGLSADITLSLGGLLYIEDQKAANTTGGTFTSGAWQTRDLNTVLTNEITGASLAANQITLPAGTYEARFSCPAYFVDRHKAKLYNITAAADIIIGSSEFTGGVQPSTNSSGFGRFVLTIQSVLELQHRCQNTYATRGLGFESNLAVIEVYSQIEIRKVV